MTDYKFPKQLFDYFATVALKNFKQDRQIETLCIGLGTKAENVIQIEELVFPNQDGTTTSVDDKGKYLNFFQSFTK